MDNLSGIIQEVLQGWNRLDSVKHLFVEILNYKLEFDEVFSKDWDERIRELFKVPPRIVASAANGEFKIIYTHLAAPKLKLTDERLVINRLLNLYPYALFVFSDADQRYWHLVNVKESQAPQTEGQRPRPRRILRRITIGPDQKYRTAAERLARIDLDRIARNLGKDIDELTAFQIKNAHDEAFDVEAVTKEFFYGYRKVFERLQSLLVRQFRDSNLAHDFALQVLNRLMFIYFIQKKRWLGNDPDFILHFWESYKNSGQPKDTFYEKWLKVLFFEVFNKGHKNKGHKNLVGRSDLNYMPRDLRVALSTAPYLNGGLFRRNKLDLKAESERVIVPDSFFEMIFDRFEGRTPGFFERYNFTIREDTPFDQEVAVDPELIGKVYEGLINIYSEGETDHRGEAGIFYTPRIEIDLMVRLSLVDWLTNQLGENYKSVLYEWVFALDPDEKEEADAKITENNLWDKLKFHLENLKVLDPACGSGSFLVGMLLVLNDLWNRIENTLGENRRELERKKRIIGRSLYGVDIMPWAVHVAELRLWLQLVVETELKREELTLEPLLPNLSLNLRFGDSLIQEIGGIDFSLHARKFSLGKRLKGKLRKFAGEKLKFYNAKSESSLTGEEWHLRERQFFVELLQEHLRNLQNELGLVLSHMRFTGGEMMTMGGEFRTPTQETISFKPSKRPKELQAEISEVEQVLKALQSPEIEKSDKVLFVWDIAFAEVFMLDKKGFDIVIGNPPYVRQEKLRKEYKEKLVKSVYRRYPKYFGYNESAGRAKKRFDKKSDLYIYFYFHGLSLLNEKGTFCFITSNSWLDVGFGKVLQEFLLTRTKLKMVIDNQVRRSFKQADINTVIVLISPPKKTEENFENFTKFVLFKKPFDDVISPVIFLEIEEMLNDRTVKEFRIGLPDGRSARVYQLDRPEFRVRAVKQADLLADGTVDGVYAGNKLGGKYLRAPDIYFKILDKGTRWKVFHWQGKPIIVEDVTDMVED